MEYAFYNKQGKERSFRLDDYSFLVRESNAERAISYASVLEIRMSRSRHEFKMQVLSDEEGTIDVSSISYPVSDKPVDQATGYALFARVLHHHLVAKSKATFTCGGSIESIIKCVGIIIVLTLISSSALDYFGLRFMNPYLLAVLLIPLIFVGCLVVKLVELPKNYDPAHIPLQFLP
ncbi:MAG: hypothetical protein JST14_09390 [Bacteroidetes bacterium]|nr:hypothetical protein [Bacteroidota bacterium]